jgi:hypothetical protein
VVTAIAITGAALLAVAWAAAVLWARPRVSPDARAVRVLGVPAVVVGAIAGAFCLLGWAGASPALWSIAGIFAAGAFCFAGGVDWHRFERDFWAHVARHQEFHVAERDQQR